jgi:hypothetical protein
MRVWARGPSRQVVWGVSAIPAKPAVAPVCEVPITGFWCVWGEHRPSVQLRRLSHPNPAVDRPGLGYLVLLSLLGTANGSPASLIDIAVANADIGPLANLAYRANRGMLQEVDDQLVIHRVQLPGVRQVFSQFDELAQPDRRPGITGRLQAKHLTSVVSGWTWRLRLLPIAIGGPGNHSVDVIPPLLLPLSWVVGLLPPQVSIGYVSGQAGVSLRHRVDPLQAVHHQPDTHDRMCSNGRGRKQRGQHRPDVARRALSQVRCTNDGPLGRLLHRGHGKRSGDSKIGDQVDGLLQEHSRRRHPGAAALFLSGRGRRLDGELLGRINKDLHLIARAGNDRGVPPRPDDLLHVLDWVVASCFGEQSHRQPPSERCLTRLVRRLIRHGSSFTDDCLQPGPQGLVGKNRQPLQRVLDGRNVVVSDALVLNTGLCPAQGRFGSDQRSEIDVLWLGRGLTHRTPPSQLSRSRRAQTIFGRPPEVKVSTTAPDDLPPGWLQTPKPASTSAAGCGTVMGAPAPGHLGVSGYQSTAGYQLTCWQVIQSRPTVTAQVRSRHEGQGQCLDHLEHADDCRWKGSR